MLHGVYIGCKEKSVYIGVWEKVCLSIIKKIIIKKWEMIFVHSYFDDFYDKLLSNTHIIFLLSLSIALVFVPIPYFLCKILVVLKVVT